MGNYLWSVANYFWWIDPKKKQAALDIVQAALKGEETEVKALLGMVSEQKEKSEITTVSIRAQDEHGNHVLGGAACGGKEKLIRFLLTIDGSKSVLELKNSIGTTPLWLAAGYGHDIVLKLLIDAGADVNTFNFAGDSAILAATSRGHTSCVSTLLKHGAKPNKINQSGDGALNISVHKENIELVKILLDAGADVNCRNKIGITSICCAAGAGNVAILKLLIAANADHTISDSNGARPLTLASACGHSEAVKLLLSETNENDLEARDNTGGTALWHASSEGHTEVIKLLLSAHANPNAANKKKINALQIAEKNGHEESLTLLRSPTKSILRPQKPQN